MSAGLLLGSALGSLRRRAPTTLVSAPASDATAAASPSPIVTTAVPMEEALAAPEAIDSPAAAASTSLRLGASRPSLEDSGLEFLTQAGEDTITDLLEASAPFVTPPFRATPRAGSGSPGTGGSWTQSGAPSAVRGKQAAGLVSAAAAPRRVLGSRRLSGFLATHAAAGGARSSVGWPTLGEMKQSIAADAAAYAASVAPIGADPGSSFAIGGMTGLSVAAQPAAQNQGSGNSMQSRSSGGGGVFGGRRRAGQDDEADAKPQPVAAPAPSQSTAKIPWRAGAGDRGLIFPDISVWRKPHDWNALSNASAGIIVMKVRQAGVDKTFNDGLEEAEKRGMIVIGYAFGYGADGAMQADALLYNFAPKPGRILMLDLEHNPFGDTMNDQQAIAFVERIKARTGRYPFLYTSASRARPGALAHCPRYVAQWGSQPANSDIWQFTNGVTGPAPHSFPGVGSCDINRLMMTYGALRLMANLDGTRSTIQVASAQRTNEDETEAD